MSTLDPTLVEHVFATASLMERDGQGDYALSSADAVAANDATPLAYRAVDIADLAALMDRTGVTVACQLARQLPASGDTLDTVKAATAAVAILNRPYRLRMDQEETSTRGATRTSPTSAWAEI